MGMIRYNITTTTKKCPYCDKTISTKTHGAFTPFYGIFFLFTFPILIPYWILRYLAFKDPDFPKVGPKFISCPRCSSRIRTDNYTVDELFGEYLFLHQFKKWIYLCYVVGAVFGVCVFGMITGAPVISLWGLLALLSFIAVVTIIIAYYIKLGEISH